MSGQFQLYVWTIRYLKPEQVFWRIAKRLGMKCALKGAHPAKEPGQRIGAAIPELDYDPVFLDWFCVEELMHDRVTFLHEAEHFDWDGIWHIEGRSHLWNFNLHYFEYAYRLKSAAHPLASPIGGGGPRKRWRGCTSVGRTLPQSRLAP